MPVQKASLRHVSLPLNMAVAGKSVTAKSSDRLSYAWLSSQTQKPVPTRVTTLTMTGTTADGSTADGTKATTDYVNYENGDDE
jgi:hypothetical protein